MSTADGLLPALSPDLSDVETVPIGRLQPADSPRQLGENHEHIRRLAESEASFPPIVVHRPSMRVIDGMHRLLATVWRGGREIQARFFDGPAEDAFVLAVMINVRHGLPLSANDRTAAAARMIRTHQNWSDRAIASVTGLSAKTVGSRRLRTCGGAPGRSARIGKDGRTRPLSSAEGRRTAARLITEDPAASLRSIATKAGISPGTVRDVRERLKRGEDPVPSGRPAPPSKQAASRTSPPRPAAAPPAPEREAIRVPAVREATFRSLCRDSPFRMTEAGRLLLRTMELHLTADHHQRFTGSAPSHGADRVSAMATACAEAWLELAALLSEPPPAPVSGAPLRNTTPAVP
jgi:hypothetical protein